MNAAEKLPWSVEKLSRGEIVSYIRIEELPEVAAIDKQTFQKLGPKSLLALPFRISGKLVCALSCGSLRKKKIWPDGLIPRLKLAGEIIAGALHRKELEEKCEATLLEVGRLNDQLRAENIQLCGEMEIKGKFEQIVGQSDAINYVFFRVEQVAPTDSAVLILGETGTGKGLIARAIHLLSGRKERPLVNVDCAALPPNLIESELFGREKGAFTGASSRQIGRFELAQGGTIVLDEIGELPLELQAKLLRAIQDGEFERLGSPRTIKVDVRIVASTRRDLKEEVQKGRFREDLFYRLHVFPITIPPLRQRLEDIPLLVNHFVSKLGRKMGKDIKTIPKQTLAALQAYSWPGNVRELEHVIERAVITTEGSTLHLAEKLETSDPPGPGGQAIESLDEAQRKHILRTLEQTGWRVEGKQGAAHLLGINPSTLRGRMRKLGISCRQQSGQNHNPSG